MDDKWAFGFTFKNKRLVVCGQCHRRLFPNKKPTEAELTTQMVVVIGVSTDQPE